MTSTILLALLLSAPAAEPASSPLRALLGIRLGDSPARVREVLGEPGQKPRQADRIHWVYGGSDDRVFRIVGFWSESPGRVESLQITAGRAFVEDRPEETGLPGIALGAPAGEVRARLGAPPVIAALRGEEGAFWEYPALGLSLEFSAGRLGSLRLADDLRARVEGLLGQADAERAAGRLPSARKLYDEAAALAPRSPAALVGAADTARRLRDPGACARVKEARDAVLASHAPGPPGHRVVDLRFPDLAIGLAACALERGDPAGAIAELDAWKALGQPLPAEADEIRRRATSSGDPRPAR